jgi:serine/threonine protein kinase
MDSLSNKPGGVACPDREVLIAFNCGDLPPRVLEVISDHLFACPRCLSALASVADEKGTLEGLRDTLKESATDPFAADPEYRRMERQAYRLFGTETHILGPGETTPERAPLRVLGHYQIVEKIGQGGMGAVYRALHMRLKKTVALKLLPFDRVSDPQAVARFLREMEAIGRLDHDNIVRATDAGEAEGIHFLVMELIDGIDLSRVVRLRGPLLFPDACELIRQAATGLQYVHEHTLVHRDVKPSNLLLSVKGEVKILDLGLALLSRNGLSTGELTALGQVMGTADYMAPEQWESCHAVDIRADLYSLGCTLYTLLVGRPPYSGPAYQTVLQKLAAHAREPICPVRVHRKDVPVPLEDLLGRMVAKDPANRPATPEEVARALEPFCQGANLGALAREARARHRPEAPTILDSPGDPHAAPDAPETPGKREGRLARLLVVAGRWRRTFLAAVLGLLAVALVLFSQTWPGGRKPTGPEPPDGPKSPAEPSGWQRVLTEPPIKRVWTPAVEALLTHDPKKETLIIQSPRVALIRLGETKAREYKLEIGFRQVPWTGGIGVYFAGRPEPTPKDFQFQWIQLRTVAPNINRSFKLVRGVGLIRQQPDANPEVPMMEFASTPLTQHLENQEHLLELVVRSRGVLRVRWNAELCRELTSADSEPAGIIDCRGEFGIYCIGSSVTVSTARIQPIQ